MACPNPETLHIVCYPDPILSVKCAPIETFDASLAAVAEKMLCLMRDASGVGLAAPQVGLAIRLFVCNWTGEPEGDLVCVNPRFLELDGVGEMIEGCLSIPEVEVTMRRATTATLAAADIHGQPFECSGEGLAARVWQHEADHLDGRLITDTMSATDEIANRRALKQLESDYATNSKKVGRR